MFNRWLIYMILVVCSTASADVWAGFLGPGIEDVKYKISVPFVDKPPKTKDALDYDRFIYHPHWDLKIQLFNKSEKYFITDLVFNCSGYEKNGNRTFHNQIIRTRGVSAIAPRSCGMLKAPISVQQGRKNFNKILYPDMNGKVISCQLIKVNGER